MEDVLPIVFWFLDPVSLKDARCVCHQWNQIIKNRLWGSRFCRKKLRSRLWYRWRNESNVNMKHLANIETRVCNLVCDEEFVYSGTDSGFMEVYCLSTGQRVHRLDCHDKRGSGRLNLDVGEAVIATVTFHGTVCVWDKIKGEMLCKANYPSLSYVMVIKVISRGAVLVGSRDGSLSLLMANQDNEWSFVNKFTGLTEEGIFHTDSDGDWVVTVTRSAVYLWSFVNNSLVLDPRSVDVKVTMLTFSFPFIFVVGGGDWAGLQVWNIERKLMVRHIEIDGRKFYYIKSNGRFLTISKMRGDGFVFIFDKKELCDPTVSNDNLWQHYRMSEPRKTYVQSPEGLVNMNESDETVIAAINTTSLVVSIGNRNNSSIIVQNFWNDSG